MCFGIILCHLNILRYFWSQLARDLGIFIENGLFVMISLVFCNNQLAMVSFVWSITLHIIQISHLIHYMVYVLIFCF